ncbi:MAG: uracil-DNA glycosylase [Bacilli bacterium]
MTASEVKEALTSFPGDWESLLKEEKNKDYYQKLVDVITKKYLSETVYPPYQQVFNALKLTPLNEVKCVIIGQDPYFNPGQANGLAFSVAKGVRLPPSLLNIYKELFYEYGYPIPQNGCLDDWAKQGVLLLNASLTVHEGEPTSHSNLGWLTFTDDLISLLNKVDRPLVYLLWGKYAQSKETLITNPKALIIKTAHPSPMSATRGFFCSDCFKKCNKYLKENHLTEINFQIKDE